MSQLARRLGQVTLEVRSQIQQLPVAQLEELGEALLDFDSMQDLRENGVNDKLPPFLAAKNLQPFISKPLRCTTNPVVYKSLKGGGVGGNALGYVAELLPGVCKVYWDAKRANVSNQSVIDRMALR